jgi:hypothetical protein
MAFDASHALTRDSYSRIAARFNDVGGYRALDERMAWPFA